MSDTPTDDEAAGPNDASPNPEQPRSMSQADVANGEGRDATEPPPDAEPGAPDRTARRADPGV